MGLFLWYVIIFIVWGLLMLHIWSPKNLSRLSQEKEIKALKEIRDVMNNGVDRRTQRRVIKIVEDVLEKK